MKKNILITLFISFFLIVSCSKKTDYKQPNVDFKNLEKDFMKWWTYHSNNIILSSNFIGLDNSSNIINKETFLDYLTSGNFIPIKLISKDENIYYQLYKLDELSHKDIRNTIKNVSSKGYKYFKMEGKNFPNFNFTDLDGITYNNQNTKGKIVVLKCWFINCKPCIAEFPELNNLVKKYQNRKDIIFVSLALDSKKDLESFLLKNSFEYTVVPDQKEFINILKINAYPTHLIIDKNGIIKKVVNTVGEMISGLEGKEFITENITKIPPPPPPKK